MLVQHQQENCTAEHSNVYMQTFSLGCDWFQPRRTESLHSTWPSLPWLRPTTVRTQFSWDELCPLKVMKKGLYCWDYKVRWVD